ncbi:hypothetical protein L7F22_018406 [Adiantum nelumboides]|nr:hypothetical protein [Adiantum nelumboides]
MEHLRAVFEMLRKERLVVNGKKSEFFMEEIHFLGHIVSKDGVRILQRSRQSKTGRNRSIFMRLEKVFHVQCDACGSSIGAVLMQDGHAITVIHALQSWKHDLLGADFTVQTDHQSLRYFLTQAKLSEKHLSWANFLSMFHFQLVHVAGKNVVADALSRRPHVAAASIAYQHELNEMRYHYSRDEDFAEPYDALVRGEHPNSYSLKNGFLMFRGKLCISRLLRQKVVTESHSPPYAGSDPEKSTVAAYLEFDTLTLAQPKGLFGALRERGVGGSRCGSTAATAVLLPLSDGKQQLIAANVGDARVLLSRSSKALQLSFDHKPNVEAERKRIEAKNPTPRKPLVVNVNGTWRVGGLLALSRAFGDAYLKDWSDGKMDGARGGFGLTAEPTVAVETLGTDDDLIILGTDGLFEEISNQEIVDICRTARSTSSAESIAKKLIQVAQKRGVTDDVSAVVVFLPQGDAS